MSNKKLLLAGLGILIYSQLRILAVDSSAVLNVSVEEKEMERKYPRPDRYSYDPSVLATRLRSCRLQLEWKALVYGSERVVYFGDGNHLNDVIRRVFASHLREFRAYGITHLAVEEPSSLQIYFDRFNKNGDKDKLINGLIRYNGDNPNLAKHLPAEYYADRIELYVKAHAAGLTIVAVDKPDRDTAFPTADQRDLYMARKIMGVLSKSPQIRVAAFLGAFHVRSDRQPKILFGFGQRSRSYIFLTSGLEYVAEFPGSNYRGLRVTYAPDYRVFAALTAAGFAGEESFLPASLAEWPCSGYLCVPEVLQAQVKNNLIGAPLSLTIGKLLHNLINQTSAESQPR